MTAARTHCGTLHCALTDAAGRPRRRCIVELSASGEVIVRLGVYSKMQDALQALPPKMLALSSTEPTLPVSLPEMSLDKRVAHVTERIPTATFTGKGDKPLVVQ